MTPTRAAAERWPLAQVLIASIFLGLALSVFLLVRRAIGAFASPLPPLPLVATAISLVAWGLCVRLALPRGQGSSVLLFTRWLPSLTIFLFAAACSYPGNRWVDWLVWLPAIVVVAGPSLMLRPAKLRAIRSTSPAVEDASTTTDQILQQLTRFRTADGKETIRGTLVAEFAAGERSKTVYVAFCPPFEILPHVEAHIADDSAATVKVAQRLHNGTQLDVRLPESPEDTFAVSVEIFAAESEAADSSRPTLAV